MFGPKRLGRVTRKIVTTDIKVTLVTHFKEDRIAKGRREFSPSLSKGIEWIF